MADNEIKAAQGGDKKKPNRSHDSAGEHGRSRGAHRGHGRRRGGAKDRRGGERPVAPRAQDASRASVKSAAAEIRDGKSAKDKEKSREARPLVNINEDPAVFGASVARRETGLEFFGFADAKEDDSWIDEMPLDPTLDAVFADALPPEPTEDGVTVVGIKFSSGSKVYYFDPDGIDFKRTDHAIVETARGLEFGDVALANTAVPPSAIVRPLKKVVRAATAEDIAKNAENVRKENEAFKICVSKIAHHGLDMKLVGAQYTFDNTKLIFYFTSAGRVDFRELVKDLASVFRTRIELRQIGIRDEAKMIGGWGVCGRKLCCSNFLPNFAQVSIRMAKDQGLSLNSSKISGTCGRLMCCLRFEQESYEKEISFMPPVDSRVKTADGNGTVTDLLPMSGSVKVKLDDKPEAAPASYKLSDVEITWAAPMKKRANDERDGAEGDNGNDV